MKKVWVLLLILSILYLQYSAIIPVHATASYWYDPLMCEVHITGSVATFAGWYAADQAGGWGTIDRTSSFQYIIDGNMVFDIYFGNSSASVYFRDWRKQIYNDGLIYWHVQNGTLELGRLYDLAAKGCSQGVQILRNTEIHAVEGTTTYFYACSIQMGNVFIEGTNRVWDCQFDVAILSVKDADMSHCLLNNAYFQSVAYTVSGDISELNVYAGRLITITQDASASIKDAVIRGNPYIVETWAVTNWTGELNLTNVESDSWIINWLGSGDTGIIYRQYTFDFSFTFQNGSYAEGTNVTITNDYLGMSDSWILSANGSIPTQTYSMGHYNMTGDDTLYNYNPYRITASLDGYETYNQTFNLSGETSWQIVLIEKELSFTIGFSFAAILLGMVAFVLVLVSVKHP